MKYNLQQIAVFFVNPIRYLFLGKCILKKGNRVHVYIFANNLMNFMDSFSETAA